MFWHSKDINKQDGRLARPCFLLNYKYFDQLLHMVENKTTVLILVFEEFLQTSIASLIFVLYAKGYHDFPLKNFRLTVPIISSRNPSASESFGYRKFLCLRENITIFYRKFVASQWRKLSLGNPSVPCFRIFLVAKKFMDRGRGGEGGSIKIFRRMFFDSQCRKFWKRTL